jgi:hypothetical protein
VKEKTLDLVFSILDVNLPIAPTYKVLDQIRKLFCRKCNKTVKVDKLDWSKDSIIDQCIWYCPFCDSALARVRIVERAK